MSELSFAIRLAALALSAVVFAAGCSDREAVGPITGLPRELTAAERVLVQRSNSFGFDLLREVRAREPGPNVFLSPVSASMALGMTMNGAAGTTWDSMRAALRLEGLTEQEINDSYRGLVDLLSGLDARVDFRIANSVWARLGFPFHATFFDVVRQYFDAEARELDFDDPGAVDVVNGWVEERTNGRIDEIINRIEAHHILFLINAMYFKGVWSSRFAEQDTRLEPFTRADGSVVQVDMMHVKDDLRYAAADGFQAVELPYGGGAYSMVVVRPDRADGLGELVTALDDDGWADLIARLDTVELELGLPKFRLEYEELLNDPLRAMGMGIAFTKRADFTRLTPVAEFKPVCIHFVIQKTFVEVDEEGTEAAAVTAVGISVTSANPPPRRLVVDRPFLFAIRERFSGTILFIGAIGDPTMEESAPAAAPAAPCPRF